MFSPHPDSINRLMMQPMPIGKVGSIAVPPVRVKAITKSWKQERRWICQFAWARKNNGVEPAITRLRIESSTILPGDGSLRHLQILPSDPAWGRAFAQNSFQT
jgi:hypothetical protein